MWKQIRILLHITDREKRCFTSGNIHNNRKHRNLPKPYHNSVNLIIFNYLKMGLVGGQVFTDSKCLQEAQIVSPVHPGPILLSDYVNSSEAKTSRLAYHHRTWRHGAMYQTGNADQRPAMSPCQPTDPKASHQQSFNRQKRKTFNTVKSRQDDERQCIYKIINLLYCQFNVVIKSVF